MLNMDPERETQSQLQAFKMEVGWKIQALTFGVFILVCNAI